GGIDDVLKSVSSSSGGGLVGGALINPGFETGDFTGWTLSGAGAVIKQFGNILPPEGQFMALIHTRTGTILNGCGPGNDCTRSTLSQAFNIGSIVTIRGKGALLSNEFPSFTS